MKYTHKKQISFVTTAAIAVLIFLILSGCAVKAPKPPVIETVKIHFKRPFVIRTPEKNPGTTEEYIRCALFYFERERFSEAAGAFERARARIIDPKNTLNRACLISSAVCHLITDNKPAFIVAVRELKATYTRYELISIRGSDQQVNTLFKLYDGFIKTGNY